jgi:hypothetical protein
VNDDDARGLRGDAFLEIDGIHAEGFVDIRKNRDGPLVYDRCRDGNPQVGRNNDFLPWANAQGRKRHLTRACPAAYCDGMLDALELSQLPFKLLDLPLNIDSVIPIGRPMLKDVQYGLAFFLIHLVNTSKLQGKRLRPTGFAALNRKLFADHRAPRPLIGITEKPTSTRIGGQFLRIKNSISKLVMILNSFARFPLVPPSLRIETRREEAFC